MFWSLPLLFIHVLGSFVDVAPVWTIPNQNHDDDELSEPLHTILERAFVAYSTHAGYATFSSSFKVTLFPDDSQRRRYSTIGRITKK